MMEFDLPKEEPSIIKVIGVGGGGSNAVTHMYQQGIVGVDFAICNTDNQSLELSPVPVKIQLGPGLTEGRGAGSKPEVGKQACIESIEDIVAFLEDSTKMVFVTAGMGGGTGTGAAPIIAKVAREMGILTVGIVTLPFRFEGSRRGNHAVEGLEEIKENVDALIMISNDKLREMHGNLSISEAFAQADNFASQSPARTRETPSISCSLRTFWTNCIALTETCASLKYFKFLEISSSDSFTSRKWVRMPFSARAKSTSFPSLVRM